MKNIYKFKGEKRMKKLVKFEKNDCNPCAMVSDLLDKKGVESGIGCKIQSEKCSNSNFI